MHFRLNWKNEAGGEKKHNKNQSESVLRRGKERAVLRRKRCSRGRNQLKRTFKLRRMAASRLRGRGNAVVRAGGEPLGPADRCEKCCNNGRPARDVDLPQRLCDEQPFVWGSLGLAPNLGCIWMAFRFRFDLIVCVRGPTQWPLSPCR